MTKKTVMAAGVLASMLFFTVGASAKWVSVAKVERVRAYADSSRIDIWFDVDVTTGCGSSDNSKVSVDSSYITSSERREQIREVALAARLSGRDVEVNTVSGCSNSLGKLDYISLK